MRKCPPYIMKEKFVNAHMKVAEVYAELSSAKKLKVGCVIIKNDTIIGIGYNGTPSGWDNNCETVIDTGELPPELITKPEVIHAEQNAISKIAKSPNSSEDAVMFITHAPCMECAKSIYQSGIKSVYYRNQYRNNSGIEFLNKCGIEVERV